MRARCVASGAQHTHTRAGVREGGGVPAREGATRPWVAVCTNPNPNPYPNPMAGGRQPRALQAAERWASMLLGRPPPTPPPQAFGRQATCLGRNVQKGEREVMRRLAATEAWANAQEVRVWRVGCV